MGTGEDVNTRLLKEQVRLQRQANRRLGCLSGVVFTLFFGVFYWMWLAIKWTAGMCWRGGALAWGAVVLAGVWCWRGSVWTGAQLVTLARAAYARMRGA